MPDSIPDYGKLGPTIRMAKYYPNGTEPKGLDHYVDVGQFATDTDSQTQE